MPDHTQKLSDVDTAGEIIREALKDGIHLNPQSCVDLVIDQFETAFRRPLTINRARQLVWRGLAYLTTDELRTIYCSTYDTDQAPVFFSRTELLDDWLRTEIAYTDRH